MLMMRDDEFLYDYIKYDEKLIEQPAAAAKLAVVPKENFDYQNMTKYACLRFLSFESVQHFMAIHSDDRIQ